MKLRTKTHLSVAIVLICLFAIIYVSAHFILLRKFEAIETENMRANIGRAVDAVNADLENLNAHVKDWAWWNDPYNYMEDRHETFISDNLMGQSLASLNINAILFFANDGQLVIERGIDIPGERLVPPAQGLAAKIADNFSTFTSADFQAGTQGVILLAEFPALICSRHILTSDRKGPSHGILAMTRNIDETKIKHWEQLTHLPIAVFRVDDPHMPVDVERAISSFSAQRTSLVTPLGSDTISAYAMMTDVLGKPAFVIKVAVPRKIYGQARTAMLYYMTSLFAAGLLFWALTVLLLDFTVIARLLRLDRGVTVIASSGDHQARVPVQGTDEISELTGSINTMLSALEKSQAEVAISESRYRTIFECTRSATAIVQQDGTLSLINDEFSKLARVSKAEIEGKKRWTDYLRYETGVNPADVSIDDRKRLLPAAGNFLFIDAYGKSHYVKSMVAEIPGMNATLLSLADFTDRKKTEDALQESEQKYRTLVESSHDAVFLVKDERIVFANGKTSEMTGYSAEELMSMPAWDTLHIEDRDRIHNYMERRKNGEKTPATYVARVVRKDGATRHFEFAMQDIYYEGRKVTLVTARDVTERQLAEEGLRKANEELERVNKVKTDFTSIVSHELRTPLGTTKQAIEIMLEGIDGPLNEKQSERLVVAKRNVERLVRLTNNVLDFAKLESGKMEMYFEETVMNALMTEIQQLMKPVAEAKKIELSLKLPQHVLAIKCDSDHIKQIVINLIDNAVKFTDEGGRVELRLAEEDGGVLVEVEDNGRGINPDDLQTLFEPFRQIRTKGTRPVQGSGLGLSICRQIVERHGGRIDAWSEFGKGTRFTMHLPSELKSSVS